MPSFSPISEWFSRPWFSSSRTSSQKPTDSSVGSAGGVSIKQDPSSSCKFSFFRPSTWWSSFSSNKEAADTANLTDFFKGVKTTRQDADYGYSIDTRTPQSLEQIQKKLEKLQNNRTSSLLIVGTPTTASSKIADSKISLRTRLGVISFTPSSPSQKEIAKAARQAGIEEAKTAISKAIKDFPEHVKVEATVAFRAMFIKPLTEDPAPMPLTVKELSQYVKNTIKLREKADTWLESLTKFFQNSEKSIEDVKKWINDTGKDIPGAVGKGIIEVLENTTAEAIAKITIAEVLPALLAL